MFQPKIAYRFIIALNNQSSGRRAKANPPTNQPKANEVRKFKVAFSTCVKHLNIVNLFDSQLAEEDRDLLISN